MRAMHATMIAALLTSVAGGAAAIAQDVIPDEETCSACSIVTEQVIRIGEVDGPGALPGGPINASVDPEGRYWLFFPEEPIMVFDAGGQFIGLVGRSGDGPGEFLNPYVAAMSDDVAIVLESRPRATVLDFDFRHVRTVALSYRRIWDAPAFGPGSVLVNGLFGSPDQVRRPFNVVDVSGSSAAVTRSFGPDLEDRSSRIGLYRLRHVFDTPRGNTIWVTEQRRYHVSKWSSEGELLDSLVRQPEWFPGFPGFSKGSMGGPDTPPSPLVVGVTSDSSGRLWVFSRIAGPRWREAWAESIARYGRSTGRAVSPDVLPQPWDLTTTVVEVLDPQARRVVYRQTLDAYVIRVLPGPRVVTYLEPDLIPTVDVLTLRLDAAPVERAGRWRW